MVGAFGVSCCPLPGETWKIAELVITTYIQAYLLTKREEFATWYKKVHEFSWSKFPDKKHGEWYGYLNRQGEVLLELKGGKWKGCFHVPRAMFLCANIFKQLAAADFLV